MGIVIEKHIRRIYIETEQTGLLLQKSPFNIELNIYHFIMSLLFSEKVTFNIKRYFYVYLIFIKMYNTSIFKKNAEFLF